MQFEGHKSGAPIWRERNLVRQIALALFIQDAFKETLQGPLLSCSVASICSSQAIQTAFPISPEYLSRDNMNQAVPPVDSNFTDDIAVISVNCRVPGASSPEEFWQNLKDGVESIQVLTDEQLRSIGVPEESIRDPRYVRTRTIPLNGIDQFDAGFFGFTPAEAEIMDPQQRLFIEAGWELFERASYDPYSYPGLIGVYAGIGYSEYAYSLVSDPRRAPSVGMFASRIANDSGALATNFSYRLNLRGPSVTVQTACSTSLVAVHLASQALLEGECDMAVAGGVSFPLTESKGYLHQEGGIFSRDGRCRAFSADASGAMRGGGVCVVLLKRLRDAIADRDTIVAVMKGSAINNDGA